MRRTILFNVIENKLMVKITPLEKIKIVNIDCYKANEKKRTMHLT